MENCKTYKFFLGGSYGSGFRSLFTQSYNVEDQWRAYIIKGGPGTGKSTLMKKIAAYAEKNGMTVEKCFCSSDISSLDAVIIPEIKAAIMDGTAPHIVEPSYPGVCETIVDFTCAWDTSRLREKSKEIISLMEKCGACHRAAQNSMSAYMVFDTENQAITEQYIDSSKIESCAKRLYSIIHPQCSDGRQHRRLLSAVTGGGVHFFEETIKENFSRTIAIDDRFSACSGMVMRRITEMLCQSKAEMYICCCSQNHDKVEHILLPSCSTAITTSNRFHSIGNGRMIHATRFVKKAPNAEERRELLDNEKKAAAMISEAGKWIRKAKSLHDELESYYIAATDFEVIDKISQKTINTIFT